MAHRYPNVVVHLVFSTKNRADSIPQDLILRLGAYLFGIGKNHHIPVLAAGATRNHVHVLIALKPDMTLAKAVQTLKANSSHWIAEHGNEFAWQEGYGAFSVSPTNVDAVRHYVLHQPEHHARRSYEQEFAGMLKAAGVEFDADEVFG